MKRIAEFAVRRRWFVIVGWLVLIVAAQGLASAAGGAAYKDTFSLPHTETASVAHLLKQAGLDDQNGVSGTVVLHQKSGSFSGPPSSLGPALATLCRSGNDVVSATSPWQAVSCAKPGAPGRGNAKLLNTGRGSNTALVQVSWKNGKYDQNLFKHAYDQLKSLRSSQLQVEFTANAFQGIG